MTRRAHIAGFVAGLALTAFGVAVGVARLNLAVRQGVVTPQVRIGLAYWREGCIPPEYVRAEDRDATVREFRERLDIPVTVEMRRDPHPESARMAAVICLGR